MASEFQPNGLYPLRQERSLPGQVYAEVVSSPGADDPKSNLLNYWEIVCRNKWKIILLTTLGAGIGYAAVLPQTPVYRAKTSLEVLEVNNSFLNIRNLDPNVQADSMETRLHTEMKMLQSTSLVRQVREKLLESDIPLSKSEDRLTVMLAKFGLPPLSAPPTRRAAIATAANSLQIRNPDLTRIVEITCESSDPRIASEFANELTQTYMDQSVAGRLETNQRTQEWLNGQIQEVKAQLEKSNTLLLQYAQGAGLVGVQAGDKLKQLDDKLSTAQADLVQKSIEYQIAKAGSLDMLPEAQQSQELRQLSQDLVTRSTELSGLRTKFAEGNIQIKRLEEIIDDLQKRKAEAQDKVLQGIASEFEKARLREEAQSKAYEEQARLVTDQSQKMLQHNVLQEEVETYRQLYTSMLQKVKEAAIASAMRASDLRVVDKAELPKIPYKPEPVQSVLTGLSTGLFLSIVLVFVRSSSDRRLRIPGDASTYLNIRELGSIPAGRPRLRGTRRVAAGSLSDLEKNSGLDGAKSSVELAIWEDGPSQQAESFRLVLVSLLSESRAHQSIVVTSPNPGDGKTSVVSNLGIALTEVGQRVLLIDADLRKPRLHQVFGVPNSWGLTDLVSSETILDRCPLEVLVKPTLVPGLYLLPSGPGTSNTVKVLYSQRTRDLLTRLEKEFDIILIDTPPMLPYPDARILARGTDGVVMVLRADHTYRETGRRAVERLADDGVVILGAVLNNWNPKSTGDQYGRDYLRSYDQR